jgi:magnesium transporter
MIVSKSLGFSDQLVSTLLKAGRRGYEDLDKEMGMIMPAIIAKGFDVTLDPLLILLRNNLLITIHSTEVKRFFRLRRYAKIYMKKIDPKLSAPDKITTVLIRVLDEHNSRNFDHLREIEENSDTLSAKLADIHTPREEMGKDIHMMKHALIVYLTGLWETIDVINTLRYGDPEILTDDPKLLIRIAGLAEEVNNQIGLAEHMSEVLASGLEVMQSIYNNQLQILNNKLAMLVAYLTVIGTAVLVPNTLATALSNPAFEMGPKDIWWYSALLVGSTIISTYIAYWWVKKRGLLPEKAE